MANDISSTGFWISNEDDQHVYIPELSKEINKFVLDNNIKTVYDFGCGRGEYLDQLTKAYPDIQATGFEGHQTDGVYKNIIKQDLSEKMEISTVDLVISIEVGEHIPKEFEQTFLDNISNHAKNHIILSWAIVGQTGLGHINCQENKYIIKEMISRGWVFDKNRTQNMRSNMPTNLWIHNTLMVFFKP